MSKSRLLVTLTVAALVAACASHSLNPRVPKTSANIKVHNDASTDQEVIEVQARNGAVPSTLSWTTDDPTALLRIEFTDAAQPCVVDVMCSGNHCTASSNVKFHGRSARCHYRTSVGASTHDPIVIIDDCCP